MAATSGRSRAGLQGGRRPRHHAAGLARLALAGAVVGLLLVAGSLSALAAPETPSPSPSPSIPASQACDQNHPQNVADPPAVLDQLGIEQAWSLSQGQDVTVAVVDSGVAAGNEHLVAAVLPGIDIVEPNGNGQKDLKGHGTVIAGQIAARPVQGSGLVGVAPKAMILPVRVFVDDTDEAVKANKDPTPARIAGGIQWAADHGAKVIAVALSTSVDEPLLANAVAYAAQQGALVVASAGNRNPDKGSVDGQPRYPAAYPDALSVTAVTGRGIPSEDVVRGSHIELAAPAAPVTSTFFAAGDCILQQDGNTTSSWATGYVAGVAALVAAKYPAESPAEWKYRLLVTATRPVAQSSDDAIGWGIVAPVAALSFINDGTAVGPHNPVVDPPDRPDQAVAPLPPYAQSDPLWVSLTVSGTLAVGAIVLLAGLLIARWRAQGRGARRS